MSSSHNKLIINKGSAAKEEFLKKDGHLPGKLINFCVRATDNPSINISNSVCIN